MLLGLLLGVANALAATATLYGLYKFAPEVATFGYFGSAPFGADVAYDSSFEIAYDRFPWEYVAVPAVLVALNMGFLPLAFRRGWLRR